ncbi:Ribonuclease P protein component [Candidatus Izimaplasma bacterium HR1]|jgi:ribonuclease P protein component|uniref:ribonuclease P protein component n=1 Tax=Candidatus Izimoplasma sp. HR1 TaxID=1541959 RepID=UPI0004F91760|nr:Ribonuclease P protein component [Candidatus Izimaplasma bacterium HR1]
MKKEYRVKKSSEIEMIIRTRQSRGNRYFVLYKNENHEKPHFRYAVSVSKKFGNAVKRNQIKRRVREIISNLDIVNLYDIFVVVKNDARALNFTEIKNSIEGLMEKQNILRRKDNEKDN